MTITIYPAALDNSAGTPVNTPGTIEVGIIFNFSVAQLISGLHMKNVPGSIAGCTISLYQEAAGAVLARRGGLTLNAGENYLSFNSPVLCPAGVTLYLMIHMPELHYTFIDASGSAPVVEGIFRLGIIADVDGLPLGAFVSPQVSPLSAPVTLAGLSVSNNYYGINAFYDTSGTSVSGSVVDQQMLDLASLGFTTGSLTDRQIAYLKNATGLGSSSSKADMMIALGMKPADLLDL